MMRRGAAGLAFLFVAMAALAASGTTYSAYHDSTAQTSTALTATNLGDAAGEFSCTVYDSDGAVIVETSVPLAPHASKVLFVDQLLIERDAKTWGLLRIESAMDLAVSIWISAAGEWVVVENLAAERPAGPVVLVASYASTQSRTTGIGLVSPQDEPVRGTLTLYDADGNVAASTPFELGPRAARYLDTANDIGRQETYWGLVVVEADAPLLLVLEYFDAGRSLIDVDVVL